MILEFLLQKDKPDVTKKKRKVKATEDKENQTRKKTKTRSHMGLSTKKKTIDFLMERGLLAEYAMPPPHLQPWHGAERRHHY